MGRSEWFEELVLWKEEGYRKFRTYPVISLSFANIKSGDYKSFLQSRYQLLTELYRKNSSLLEGNLLSDEEKAEYRKVSLDLPETVAGMAVHRLAGYLFRYYGDKFIILLDEHDTPLQEAYMNGYWEEAVAFIRDFFNSAFKTNS